MTPERIERAVADCDRYAVEHVADFAAVGERVPGRHVDDAIAAGVALVERGQLTDAAANALGFNGHTLADIRAYASTTATADR